MGYFFGGIPPPPVFLHPEKPHQMYTSKMEEAEEIQVAGGREILENSGRAEGAASLQRRGEMEIESPVLKQCKEDQNRRKLPERPSALLLKKPFQT